MSGRDTKFKKGMIPWNKGIPRSDEVKRKISIKLKGRISPVKGMHGMWNNPKKGKGKKFTCLKCGFSWRQRVGMQNKKFCSRKCYGLYTIKPIGKKLSPSQLRERVKNRKRYRDWRTNVFKRDNYTCQICFRRSGAGERFEINADHIKRWAEYPRLRYKISNGRTLCVECHKKTPTYAVKKYA